LTKRISLISEIDLSHNVGFSLEMQQLIKKFSLKKTKTNTFINQTSGSQSGTGPPANVWALSGHPARYFNDWNM
jgi:hypothetical protein